MKHVEDGRTAKRFVCSDTKKNVFLIGDSIRIGYCNATREALAEVAEVFFTDDNCRNTQYVITNLFGWANMFSDPARVDLVLFNCGHWDVARWSQTSLPLTSEGEYERNLGLILELIKKLFPNAHTVFATTTPMNPNGEQGQNRRTNADVIRYNEIATSVMNANGIETVDLFAAARAWDSSCYSDYCHPTAEASATLGRAVATALHRLL